MVSFAQLQRGLSESAPFRRTKPLPVIGVRAARSRLPLTLGSTVARRGHHHATSNGREQKCDERRLCLLWQTPCCRPCVCLVDDHDNVSANALEGITQKGCLRLPRQRRIVHGAVILLSERIGVMQPGAQLARRREPLCHALPMGG